MFTLTTQKVAKTTNHQRLIVKVKKNRRGSYLDPELSIVKRPGRFLKFSDATLILYKKNIEAFYAKVYADYLGLCA